MTLLILFFLSILLTGIYLATGLVYIFKAQSVITLDRPTYRLKEELLRKHIKWMKNFCWMTLLSVVLVRLIVIDNNGRWGPQALVNTHLVLVMIGSLLLALVLYYNGKRNRTVHKKVVYPFLLLFVAMLVTGLWLFLHHPLLLGS